MPYISQEKRVALDPAIEALHKALLNLQSDDENNNFEGNLNYVFTRLLRLTYGLTGYTNINDAMGVLLCSALEHYRTVAAPYENQKIFENGDVSSEKEPVRLETVVVEQTK